MPNFRGALGSAMIVVVVAGEFCGIRIARERRSGTRYDRYADAWNSLGKQFGQPDKVVGGHGEGELPVDFRQPAMPHLAQAGHRLGPAEGLLDAFADALGDRISGMAGGAGVDRRTATAGVLRNMRRDRLVAQLHNKFAGVVSLCRPRA